MPNSLSESSGRMLLSIQMIVDAMNERLWEFSPHVQGDRPILRGCQFYQRGMQLSEDTLYIISEGEGSRFPIHRYCYVASEDLFGAAPNIHSLHRPVHEIANLVYSVFRSYHDFESSLSDIVNNGGTLTLCYPAGQLAALFGSLERNRFAPKRVHLLFSGDVARLALTEAKKDGGTGLILTKS